MEDWYGGYYVANYVDIDECANAVHAYDGFDGCMGEHFYWDDQGDCYARRRLRLHAGYSPGRRRRGGAAAVHVYAPDGRLADHHAAAVDLRCGRRPRPHPPSGSWATSIGMTSCG